MRVPEKKVKRVIRHLKKFAKKTVKLILKKDEKFWGLLC